MEPEEQPKREEELPSREPKKKNSSKRNSVFIVSDFSPKIKDRIKELARPLSALGSPLACSKLEIDYIATLKNGRREPPNLIKPGLHIKRELSKSNWKLKEEHSKLLQKSKSAHSLRTVLTPKQAKNAETVKAAMMLKKQIVSYKWEYESILEQKNFCSRNNPRKTLQEAEKIDLIRNNELSREGFIEDID